LNKEIRRLKDGETAVLTISENDKINNYAATTKNWIFRYFKSEKGTHFLILMKLVKYNEGRLGALVDDNVIDLNHAFAAYKKSKGASNPQRKADAKVPSCLRAFIKEGNAGLEKAQKAIDHVKAGACNGPKGEKLVWKKGEYKLRAPLPSNGTKIAMAGANFYDHSIDAYNMLRGDTTTLEELKKQVERGDYRTWGFWKLSCFVRDPDGETPYPARTKRMNYEVELAAVLDKDAKDTKEEDGMSYIYGYTIVNDLSIRDGGFSRGPNGFFFAKILLRQELRRQRTHGTMHSNQG